MIPDHFGLIIVLFCAYFIRGAAGFGSGLIAMPLLALSHPLSYAVPLVLTLDLMASFALTRVQKDLVRWPEIRWLLPFGLLGALAGVFLLVKTASSILLPLLGAAALVVGICSLRSGPAKQPISRFWAAPAGLAGGCAGAVFGTGAPPYIMYLSRRLTDKSMLRATFSWIFMVEGSFRLILFAVAGFLFEESTRTGILIGILPMAAGLFAGNTLHHRLSDRHIYRVVSLLLMGSGLALLIKSLG